MSSKFYPVINELNERFLKFFYNRENQSIDEVLRNSWQMEWLTLTVSCHTLINNYFTSFLSEYLSELTTFKQQL